MFKITYLIFCPFFTGSLELHNLEPSLDLVPSDQPSLQSKCVPVMEIIVYNTYYTEFSNSVLFFTVAVNPVVSLVGIQIGGCKKSFSFSSEGLLNIC